MDVLDEEEGDHLLIRGDDRPLNERGGSGLKEGGELSDWTRELFPSTPSTGEGEEESVEVEEVEWIEATRKVVVMTVGRIPEARTDKGDEGTVGDDTVAIGVERGTAGERRVLLGCEDGSLLILASPSITTNDSTSTTTTTPNPSLHSSANQFNNPILTNSNSISISNTSSPPPTPTRRVFTPTKLILNGRPIIPPYSPPGSSAGGRRISSASSYAPSISDAGYGGGSSGAGGTGSGSGSGVGRTRKASATVSISLNQEANEPLSPSFPAVGSPTLSMSGTSSPPFGFIGASSVGGGGGGKHRAKESITSGIGLWEGDSSTIPSFSPSTSSILPSPIDPPVEHQPQQIERRVDEGRLEVLLRVDTVGRGSVVGLEMVFGLRYGREEGGVGVLLRADG